jgi:hypothetical protein
MLQGMIEATQRETLPELDSRLLQERLRQQWLRQQSQESAPRFARMRWFAVALAAVVLAVGSAAVFVNQATPPRTAAKPAALVLVNGAALHTGAIVSADNSPVSVVHAGKARWVLAPHSTVRVVSSEPCLTLGLDQGRIDADVVPNKGSETFAIETRTHRVAVHGTRFSVTLEPSSILVQVTSGVVAVSERASERSAERTWLSAPRTARFPYAEIPPVAETAASVDLPRVASHAPARLPARQQPADASVTSESLIPELPLSPPAIEQATALDFVRAAAARCFALSQTGSAIESTVLVHLETQLTITLAPGGNVQDVSFAPPVPEAILTCTFREIQGWAGSRSRMGTKASRTIILAN